MAKLRSIPDLLPRGKARAMGPHIPTQCILPTRPIVIGVMKFMAKKWSIPEKRFHWREFAIAKMPLFIGKAGFNIKKTSHVKPVA